MSVTIEEGGGSRRRQPSGEEDEARRIQQLLRVVSLDSNEALPPLLCQDFCAMFTDCPKFRTGNAPLSEGFCKDFAKKLGSDARIDVLALQGARHISRQHGLPLNSADVRPGMGK